MTETSSRALLALTGALLAQLAVAADAQAASAQQLAAEGRAALNALYGESNKAGELGRRAKAVLVFPDVVKAGVILGGQGGEGVLFVDGQATSFWRISAASVGYQLGVQRFGYALFFISQASLDHLRNSNGWAVGTGPSLVLVDSGMARNLNTMTLQKEVYAMSFSQRGLMAGAGLEGSKVTQITPDP